MIKSNVYAPTFFDYITGLGKKIILIWIRFATNRSLQQRFRTVFQPHPEYRHPIDRDVEKKHLKLWKTLRNDVNLDTLRLCSNISGISNYRIVPEEVFASDIQRSLCKQQEKIQYLANKSFYNRWYSGNVFPEVFVHNIDGIFFNNRYISITENEISKILGELDYPVVIKPNMDSMGGANVFFPKDENELKSLMENSKNYVVQEVIRQHEFFDKYNRHGLNTIRLDLYRSVVTNDMHYLHAALRMGKGGDLDNETAGGIHCFINEDGYLNDYAVDKIGDIYTQHPDTKLKFCDESKIPFFDEMKKLAIEIAKDLYLSRLISLDMCLDRTNRWRVIEINLFDITIQFAQLGGKPFFGHFTKEVIDYCKQNPWWKL